MAGGTMRGQSAVEYASILAVVLVGMIPIVYLSLTGIEDGHRNAQASVAVVTLADAADLVFAQGPGSSTIVDIYMPRAVNPDKTNVAGKEIRVSVYLTNGGEDDFFAMTMGNLTGSIPYAYGRHRMRVEMLYSGVVQINEAS